MKLFTFWRSSSAYRVRIALGLKGLTYQPEFVHLARAGGEQHSADFRRKNPLGQIPVLQVEGERGEAPVFLTQSLAIIEYVEERFPEPPLLPKDLLARARVRELAELINSGIQPFQNLTTTNFLDEVAPQLDEQRWFSKFVAGGLQILEARARAFGALPGRRRSFDCRCLARAPALRGASFGAGTRCLPNLAAHRGRVPGAQRICRSAPGPTS
jgi:maleylacetoacetate isomerase